MPEQLSPLARSDTPSTKDANNGLTRQKRAKASRMWGQGAYGADPVTLAISGILLFVVLVVVVVIRTLYPVVP